MKVWNFLLAKISVYRVTWRCSKRLQVWLILFVILVQCRLLLLCWEYLCILLNEISFHKYYSKLKVIWQNWAKIRTWWRGDQFRHLVLSFEAHTPVIRKWSAPANSFTIMCQEVMLWGQSLLWVHLFKKN